MDRVNSIVVEIGEMIKHPNADMLSTSQVAGNFTVVMNTAQWEETFSKRGNRLAAYIYPEGKIGSKLPQFDFLGEREKDRIVKAKKIRGIISYGLLTQLPEGNFTPGDSVDDIFEITHYEPDEGVTISTKADSSHSPKDITVPKYDVEALRKAVHLFEGKEIVATEKAHGSSAKFLYKDNEVFIGSRNRWVKDDGENIWSRAYRKNQQIENFLKDNPGLVLFGEVYGNVKNFHYGLKPGEVDFVAFDVMRNYQWVNYSEFADLMERYGIATPPIMFEGVFDLDKLNEIIENDSPLAQRNAFKNISHICEGVVVKTKTEEWDYRYGRVQGKLVSLRYYNKT